MKPMPFFPDSAIRNPEKGRSGETDPESGNPESRVGALTESGIRNPESRKQQASEFRNPESGIRNLDLQIPENPESGNPKFRKIRNPEIRNFGKSGNSEIRKSETQMTTENSSGHENST